MQMAVRYATTAVEDTFGHSQLSGTGKCLEYIIKQNIQVKVRSINILQIHSYVIYY